MYGTMCELRSTLGRDRDDEVDDSTITGLLIARFRAKVVRRIDTTGYEGASTASNDTSVTLIAPNFGVDVIPHAHTVVFDGQGHIVNGVTKWGRMLRITTV